MANIYSHTVQTKEYKAPFTPAGTLRVNKSQLDVREKRHEKESGSARKFGYIFERS